MDDNTIEKYKKIFHDLIEDERLEKQFRDLFEKIATTFEQVEEWTVHLCLDYGMPFKNDATC